ncbi:hypothetical protein [Lacipirellula sp.]|uniref:hypothetical protein n=1 Tax=Lacipirellula sp. TaxID=2691419 RepID=UPI003D101D80
MSSSAQDLLKSFDILPEAEQRLVAGEIFRRTSQWETAPLADEELTLAAEATFLSLDEREEQDAERPTR